MLIFLYQSIRSVVNVFSGKTVQLFGNWMKKMQGVAFALSPSTVFGKPLSKTTNLRRVPPASSSKLRELGLISRVSCQRSSQFVSCSAWFIRRGNAFKVKAVSVPDNVDANAKSSNLCRNVVLGSMFGIWYLLNIFFNILNKQVLKVYPYPATVTAFQLGCGSVMIILMWACNLHSRPKITRTQLTAIVPLAVVHTLGNLLTTVSLGKVNVSFTHTIKAMEPFFTVLFSILFLGEWPTSWVVSSLIPIVGGVALASLTEASFNWTGFCSAMASNVTNQSRNVLSKKLMVNQEEALDNINLFSVITIISFILLVPMAILMEGIKFSPSYLQSAASQGLNVRELCIRSLLAGFCFHSYQQVSYMILQMVSPVSHAVGNCVKRVVVIVSSVIFFRTSVSPINALGTAMALAGVFLYSRVKRMKPKPKAA